MKIAGRRSVDMDTVVVEIAVEKSKNCWSEPRSNDEQFQAICLYQSVTRPPHSALPQQFLSTVFLHSSSLPLCLLSIPHILFCRVNGASNDMKRRWVKKLTNSGSRSIVECFLHIFDVAQFLSRIEKSLSRFTILSFYARVENSCKHIVQGIFYKISTLSFALSRLCLLRLSWTNRVEGNIRPKVHFSSRNRVLQIEKVERALFVSVRERIEEKKKYGIIIRWM